MHIKDAKRIVIKIGSSSLTYDNGKPNLRKIEKLARVLIVQIYLRTFTK